MYHMFNYTLPSVPSFLSSGDYREDFIISKDEEKVQGLSIFFSVINMPDA